jgi:hypothetical protein
MQAFEDGADILEDGHPALLPPHNGIPLTEPLWNFKDCGYTLAPPSMGVKVLKVEEMIDIVSRAPREIDDLDSYRHFLEDLAGLITTHFGGECGDVVAKHDDMDWSCAFHHNDCVPDDGGVYKKYDTGVEWNLQEDS